MDNLIESNERTLVMFDSVCNGLSACLALVHTDIRQITEHRNKLAQSDQNQIQAKLMPPAQELVAGMQYSKQLEANLLKVGDLRTKYEMHKKMGLVVKSVSKASIENTTRIETEFESYMGSFLLAVEDVQGFARVCQGDRFEISIKYGNSQKFKTRIKVLKDNRQKCDNRQAVFKARIADVLAIKAYECKGLGKRVLLGHKLCETRDLFTARSQLMTISLNQIGSIKLNLIVTWNPLHLTPKTSSFSKGLDSSHVSLPATSVSSSTLSSRSSMPSLNGTTTTINIQSNNHHHQLNNSIRKQQHSPESAHYPDTRNSSMYQTVDPTYGYYVPPPDYIQDANDARYQDD